MKEQQIKIVAQEPDVNDSHNTAVEIQPDCVITVKSYGKTYTVQAIEGGGILVSKPDSFNIIPGPNNLMIV